MTTREFFAALNRHKTKITGLMLVVIGALQANAPAMQALMTPRQFAWFMVLAGVLVAILGFLNGHGRRP